MNLTRLAFITLLFGLLVACDTAGAYRTRPAMTTRASSASSVR